MGTRARSLQAALKALKEAYSALNRKDVDGFVAVLDPQVERIEPSDFPHGGIYHGLEAVRAHVAKGRGSWAEGTCKPVRFIVAPPHAHGDRIIVLVRVRVRLRGETAWRKGDIADVFTLRDGKAVQFRTFADVAQGMSWAGVAPE